MLSSFPPILAWVSQRVERSAIPIAILAGVFSISNAFSADYEAAHQLVLQQKWAEALPLLRELHGEEPESSLIGADLAGSLLRLNHRDEAIALFKHYGMNEEARVATSSFATQEDYKQFQEGLNLLDARKFSQACEKFEKTLSQEIGNAEVLLRLAQCETLNGSPARALKSLDELEKTAAPTPESGLWRGKATMDKGGEGDVPVGLLQKAAQELPQSENAAVWYSDALGASGHKDAAIAFLENDTKKNPMHLLAWLTLAKLRFSAGTDADLLEAAKILDSLQTRVPAYTAPETTKFEGRAGVDLRDPELIKRATEQLQAKIAEKKLHPAS